MSTITEEVVQGDTPVAAPPLDYPTQTWVFAVLADHWIVFWVTFTRCKWAKS